MKNLFRSLTVTQRGIVIAVLSAIVFGLWPPALRGVYQDGGNASFTIIVVTWVRGLSMAAFCAMTRRALFSTRKETKEAFIGGIYQAVSLIAAFEALHYIPGPIMIIILLSHTLMLLLFLAIRKEIELHFVTLAATVSALGGLALVLDIAHQDTSGSLLGIGLAFFSAVAIVSRAYVYGKQTAERHPIVVGAENFLFAAILCLPIALYEFPRGPATLEGYALMAVGSVASSLGMFGMFYGISLLGAFRWSLYIKLEPIFTSLFSAWLIGETLKASQYLGIAVVVASLVAYQVADSRRKARLEAQKQILAR